MEPSLIISYRPENCNSSIFLNITELLKSHDISKISTVYKNIFYSITAYEPKAFATLANVEESLYNRIISLEKHNSSGIYFFLFIILMLLTAGIAKFVLEIQRRCLIAHVKESRQNHLRHIQKMQERALEKNSIPPLQAWEDLKSQHLVDTEKELSRLLAIPRVKRSLDYLKRVQLSTAHQVALGRSLELREKIKDTHYVINHGQNIPLMILNVATRIFQREFESNNYNSFEMLRHKPLLEDPKKNISPVDWYTKNINKGKTDWYFREELLCGDCFLESAKVAESAISFFIGRQNIAIAKNGNFFRSTLFSVLRYYLPSPDAVQKLGNQLIELTNELPVFGGNLYSVCIPKEKFEESCYFSYPYGIAYREQSACKNLLEEFQSGKQPVQLDSIPQIRVLTDKIHPKEGFHVVLNSTLSPNQIKEMENRVYELIYTTLLGHHTQLGAS